MTVTDSFFSLFLFWISLFFQAGQYRKSDMQPKSCEICPKGWVSTIGSAKCQICEAGKYGNEDGKDECKHCESGQSRSSKALDASKCISCELGSTSGDGAAECSGCDLGMYGSVEGTCAVCPAGKYQDGKGTKECFDCPVDTHLADTGKSSKADCIACTEDRTTGILTGQTSKSSCLCRRGEYYRNEGDECISCPDGADCSSKNGIVLAEMIPKTSFWRAHSNSAVFLDCKRIYTGMDEKTMTLLASERCCPPGRCNGTTVTNRRLATTNSTWDTNAQCEDGYSGPMCGGCQENYVVRNGGCELCNSPSSISQGMIGLVIFCLILFCLFSLIFMRIGRRKKKKHKKNKKNVDLFRCCCGKKKDQKNENENNNNKEKKRKISLTEKKNKQKRKDSIGRFVGDQSMIQRTTAASSGDTKSMNKTDVSLITDRIKIVYGWLQIFSSTVQVFPNVPFPENFKLMSLSFNVINIDLSVVFGFADCSMSLNYLQKFVIHASVPVALMITLYAATIPARLIHRSNSHGIALVREYLVKWIVVLILIMYPGLCVRTFLVLKCSNHENLLGSEYLMVDYAVQCWTSYHMKYVILSFVSIGIYVVGVPLMAFLFLRKNKAHLFDEASPKHEALVLEMGSLYTQYEEKYWYVCVLRVL